MHSIDAQEIYGKEGKSLGDGFLPFCLLTFLTINPHTLLMKKDLLDMNFGVNFVGDTLFTLLA